jgi:hypothetical protein
VGAVHLDVCVACFLALVSFFFGAAAYVFPQRLFVSAVVGVVAAGDHSVCECFDSDRAFAVGVVAVGVLTVGDWGHRRGGRRNRRR